LYLLNIVSKDLTLNISLMVVHKYFLLYSKWELALLIELDKIFH